MSLERWWRGKRRKDSRLTKTEIKLRNEIDLLRSYIDLPRDLVDTYYADSARDEYWSVFDKDEPKVSICIATYNRAELLVERSIRSALGQSYQNVEVIVVGDHCSDDTGRLVGAIKDKRLRFVNLPERGNYPKPARLRWMVAGSTPMNHALDMATGDFITHLDDDDEHLEHRVETLLALVKRKKLEFVWHPFWYEKVVGEWSLNEALTFASGSVTTSSVLYHHWFKRIKWDLEAWRLQEPGDWNRFRKFKYLNPAAERFGEPLLRHFKERNQRNG